MSRLLGIVLVLLAFLVPVEASRISRRALEGFGEVSALNSSLLHPSRTANSDAVVAQNTSGRSATNLVARAWNGTASPSYDATGNLRSDGARWFDYDLEDQLVSVYSPGEWRVDYAYDAWRRVRIKRESTWSGAWSQTNEVRYVYDGRLVLQECDGSNRPVATYTQGPDLSGSLDGAGGIGGLLSMRRGTQDTAYFADAGGNVTALVNANQQVVGRYLYDAYGGLIGMSGPMSEVNRYRFSSKEVDPTSGLYSFGHRFYAAEFQRWLNRDPIEEDGGINLFGYVGNDPVANVDPWGLVVLDDDGFPVEGSYNGLGAYRYDRDTKREHDGIMSAAKARVRQMVDDAGSLLLGMINWEGKAASAVPKLVKALPKVCKAVKKPANLKHLDDVLERSGQPLPALTSNVKGGLQKLSKSSGLHHGELSRRFHQIKARGDTPGAKQNNWIDNVTGDVWDGNRNYIGNVFDDF